MKIESFKEDSIYELKRRIEEWMNRKGGKIEIKSISHAESGKSYREYTALLLYEEKENKKEEIKGIRNRI